MSIGYGEDKDGDEFVYGSEASDTDDILSMDEGVEEDMGSVSLEMLEMALLMGEAGFVDVPVDDGDASSV